MLLKPMLETASMIHSAKEGVNASQARNDEDIMKVMMKILMLVTVKLVADR